MTKLQIVMGEKKNDGVTVLAGDAPPAGDTNTSNNHPHTQISATYALTVDGWHRFSAGTTVSGGGTNRTTGGQLLGGGRNSGRSAVGKRRSDNRWGGMRVAAV